MNSNQKPLVYAIGTGGTMAVRPDDRMNYTDYGYVWPEGKIYTMQELVERIPEVNEFANVRAEQFVNVGSTLFYPSHWIGLAKRINQIFREVPEAAGVAVTHGTATLEETAYFLNLTVKSDRPVVVTGSMRPPGGLSSDADINLLDSISVAASPEAKGKGVMTLLNDEIQAARDVTKTNTFRLQSFRANQLGLLGYADSDHQVVFYRSPTRKHTYQTEFDVENLTELPRVDIVHSYCGADGLLIRALVDAGVPGIVVAGMGSGASPPEFMEAVEEAREKNTVVVVGSQTGSGRVAMTKSFKKLGIVAADDLAPKKARVLLMLALTVTNDVDRIQEMIFSY